MLKIAVCDDNESFLETLKRIILILSISLDTFSTQNAK